ncbi:MAG: patatin-like phospholipase family protein [Anaerolineales bacterium]
MEPFRKHVALAVDGGGIRGVIVTRALSFLEEHLERPAYDIFQLLAGTSTGSIISAGIASGLFGMELHRLYLEFGTTIFKKRLRTLLWPLTRYRYPQEPLRSALKTVLGDRVVGDLWETEFPLDVIITTFDLVENRTRFIKPFKEAYQDWSLVKAVLASSAAPTFFPAVDGRFVDGGVGSYHNPAYLAAYEARFVLDWDPADTTLISLGTGRDPHHLQPDQVKSFFAWDWIQPILGAFMQSSDDQQIHLVDTFFEEIDFRRFQVDLKEPIGMDEAEKMEELTAYGEELGQKILSDEMDETLEVQAKRAPQVEW